MALLTIFYLITIIVTTLYIYSKYKFSYWKKRNVFYVDPAFLFGSAKDTFLGSTAFSTTVSGIYNEAKRKKIKYFGLYKFWNPSFVPMDLDLVKRIVQTDFSHFPNHGSMFLNEKNDPLSGHLFNLEDEKWRNFRTKLTPTFSSGKLKMMFQTVVENSTGLQKLLTDLSALNEPVEIKDVLCRFTTDVIGSVAFGLDINCMKNPDSEFRTQGIKTFKFTNLKRIKYMMMGIFPKWFIDKIGMSFSTPDTTIFFTDLVKSTVNYREKHNIFRKDFMHLLIQLKNFGRVTDANESTLINKDKTKVQQGITINEMAAQAFVFFAAGFETSSTTMTFALLELAQNIEIQEKVREEIKKIMKKYDNQITYEGIIEMEYLDNVVSETLRRHAPLALLPRICTKDYKIPDSDLVIQAGTYVEIPVMSIQMDPDYYPDPMKFDPDRFNPENKAKRHPFAYMPFGEGPRICIGLRLGKIETKVGLCSVLSNFRVTLNEKTRIPIEYEPGFVTSTKGGVYLNLEPVNNNK